MWQSKTYFRQSFVIRDELYVQLKDIGLMRMEGDSLRLVRDGERFTNSAIATMLPYDDRKILIGTQKSGLFLYDGKRVTAFETEATPMLRENRITHGAILSDDRLAFATSLNGVAILDKTGQFIYHFHKGTGLLDNHVNFVYQDRQGGLWLAMSNGLTRIEISSPNI